MSKYGFILLIFLFGWYNGAGQQTNTWYFGDHAGLSFATSPPTALLNGQLNTMEGCATISDNTGNLLFYTDGIKVWNRNHQVMPNGSGLMGHISSTHSAIVIPKPGNSTIYYLFTSDASDENFGAAGYRYSEVDITLNGGLGDVTTIKNVLLFAPGTEKLTAASHANGIDIWVIAKEWDNHVFRSYKVTCNGIDPVPVVSSVDPKNGATNGYKFGCIKVSPDGTKIASARNGEGKCDLFKFDNATGILSDRIMFSQPLTIFNYGVEFSPNSQIVYFNGGRTWQYKIDVYDSATIYNSRYAVDNVNVIHAALQLGPDGKIYSNTFPNSSVIANPDVYGPGCNYQEQAISLGGRNGWAGYPTFFNRLVTNNNVGFTYAVQPNCQSVNFSGTTNIPGPLTWQWDFGDGNTATGQNVNHIFPPTPNQFIVTLTVSNSAVCGGTATRAQTIILDRIAPVADFDFTTSCGNLSVSFQNLSTIANPGVITSYLWDFGDGNTSSLPNPVHPYASYGPYTVTLTAVSGDACNSINTRVRSVVVAARPTADFSVRDTCFTAAIPLTNNSGIASGSITGWAWNFGDGNTSGLQSPSHVYSTPGTYNVTLVTTSDLGCVSAIFPRTVIAGAKPIVDFSLPAVCLLDASASFTNGTTINDASGLSYLWNFDDPNATPPNPNTSVLIHPTHQYSLAANYNVKLVAASSLGCKDSLTRVFTVNGAVPRARFTIENTIPLCSNADVIIKDSSYVDFGNITRVVIDWGDGNTVTDNNPGQMPNGHIYTHRYASFSSPASLPYTITMRSYSGGVCVDSYMRTITMNATPELRFDPVPEVCNEAATFNITQASVMWGLIGTGTYSGTGIVNSIAGTFNPALVSAGSHLVTYTFITSNGCRTDSSRLITVNSTPVSSFTSTHGCLPDASVQFTSTSTIQGGNTNSLQHFWNFGDPLANAGNPNTSTAIHPAHIYHSLDSFAVQLQTVSNKGCRHDTIIKLYANVSIFPQPVADFKIDSTQNICAGSPVYFISQSTDGGQPIIHYHWDFGDGGVATVGNPNHLYSSHGNYDVLLWVENLKGCRSSITSKPAVIHSIPQADFRFDSTCYGKPVQFFDQSTNSLGTISGWNWNMGNGNTSILQNPFATYLNYQPFTVTLKAATANGCVSAPVSKTFTIQRVNVFAGRDTAVARNQPLQLQATGASSYIWSPSAGLNNAAIANPVATLTNSPQLYYLKGITTEGCIGFDTINIKVFDKADIYVPTGFTPNGDGLNDFLYPICIGIKQFNYFRIYDRSGSLVFQSKNVFDKWDGTIKGAKPGTQNFVWIAEVVTYDGRVIQRKGNLILIR